MAFNYGKNTIEIKNPFKAEGLMDLILGGATLLLGIIVAFMIRSSINNHLHTLAWIEMLMAIVFIATGVRFLSLGGFRVFRFLVGRDIPSNISPSPYDKKAIEKILMNRSNPTFIERKSFVSRLLISLYDKLLFLPIGFKNLIESSTSLFLSFSFFFVIYLLTVFSSSIGLIKLTEKDSIISLFGLLFIGKQFITWLYYMPSRGRISSNKPSVYESSNIVFNIFLAILIPIILELLAQNGMTFPPIKISLFLPIFLLFLFSISILGLAFFLSVNRLDILSPETAVSEYKDHVQASIHPKDFFRCFEIEMANNRYKELPNRVYKKRSPILKLEGSKNKGSFYGSTIQETQPIYKEEQLPEIAQKVRLYTAIAGRALFFISLLYLFIAIENLGHDITLNSLFNTLYYPIITALFSYYLIKIAHLFYAEILFSSYLVHFFTEGTYTESKVSSGMSVYDSNRSENTVVNTNATPWILVSEIVSSTFADSSTKNLEGNRYILEMYKADDFLDHLVHGFTNYLSNQKLIAGFSSNADIETSMNFHKLNEATRGSMRTSPKIEEEQRRNEIDDSSDH